jgi:hypothetical protein
MKRSGFIITGKFHCVDGTMFSSGSLYLNFFSKDQVRVILFIFVPVFFSCFLIRFTASPLIFTAFMISFIVLISLSCYNHSPRLVERLESFDWATPYIRSDTPYKNLDTRSKRQFHMEHAAKTSSKFSREVHNLSLEDDISFDVILVPYDDSFDYTRELQVQQVRQDPLPGWTDAQISLLRSMSQQEPIQPVN